MYTDTVTDSKACITNKVQVTPTTDSRVCKQTVLSADWLKKCCRGLVIAGCGDEEEVIQTESGDEGEEGTGDEKETKQATGGYACSKGAIKIVLGHT